MPVAIRCETPSQIRAAFAARRRQLGLSQLELDQLAGVQDQYSGKCEIGTRNYGEMSLSCIMGALGFEMILVERPEAAPKPAEVWGNLRENLDRLGLDLLLVEKPRPRALPKPLGARAAGCFEGRALPPTGEC